MAYMKLLLVFTIVSVFAVGTQAGGEVVGVVVPTDKTLHPVITVPSPTGRSAGGLTTAEKIQARSAVADEVVLAKSAAAAALPITVGRTVIGTTKDFPDGVLISPPAGRVVSGHSQQGKAILNVLQQQQGKAILNVLQQQQQQGKSFHHQQQQQQQQQRSYSRRRGHRQRYPSSESSESGSGSSSSSSSESYERPSRYRGRGLSTGR